MILSYKDIRVLQISLVTQVTKFHILKNQVSNLNFILGRIRKKYMRIDYFGNDAMAILYYFDFFC